MLCPFQFPRRRDGAHFWGRNALVNKFLLVTILNVIAPSYKCRRRYFLQLFFSINYDNLLQCSMNINQVTLIGHITQDPVSKEFGEKNLLTKFTIATNSRPRGKNKEAATEYHSITTFGKLAEICRDYVKKGRLVYVQGRLKTSRWEDKKNVLHTKTDIIANEMLLLDKQQALVRAETSQEDLDATEAMVELTPEMVQVTQPAG